MNPCITPQRLYKLLSRCRFGLIWSLNLTEDCGLNRNVFREHKKFVHKFLMTEIKISSCFLRALTIIFNIYFCSFMVRSSCMVLTSYCEYSQPSNFYNSTYISTYSKKGLLKSSRVAYVLCWTNNAFQLAVL